MAHVENHLIERLPLRYRKRFLSLCEPVQLVLSDILYEPGQPIRHVYFPSDGYVSLVTLVEDRPGVEVGMVGREGMLGVQLVLGVKQAPWRALVQGQGTAWRMESALFTHALAASPALQRDLKHYLYVLMAQQAASAGCLRFHLIDQRLARWLLMSQDRAHSDSFRVTHEFLAYMLGMRRVGVTAAASQMQKDGLIEYRRGELTVLNRTGLEAMACTCYAADRRTYDELLG
ncbi:MAG: Crp/Fnr family transcriptional regulator [Polaromonas sp.]|uniref:Crp/Fnr family transcriptional regulator n=1 Tax=Polaromonas sp. TaxID=1869339 RepID=UPI00182CE2DB|nr:Crp/Fnr family transcriptional regulator [Polaromonas sp.]MBA3592473.1 Crp/Fnr family transcriptional regulator [Polaromonas sp.]